MAPRALKRKPKLSIIAPIYFIPREGSPSLRLTLVSGRWQVTRVTPRQTRAILAARTCGSVNGDCWGQCPQGRICTTLIFPLIKEVYAPAIEGVPNPGGIFPFHGYRVTGVRRECRCL